jgi:hypothetical protein
VRGAVHQLHFHLELLDLEREHGGYSRSSYAGSAAIWNWLYKFQANLYAYN